MGNELRWLPACSLSSPLSALSSPFKCPQIKFCARYQFCGSRCRVSTGTSSEHDAIPAVSLCMATSSRKCCLFGPSTDLCLCQSAYIAISMALACQEAVRESGVPQDQVLGKKWKSCNWVVWGPHVNFYAQTEEAFRSISISILWVSGLRFPASQIWLINFEAVITCILLKISSDAVGMCKIWDCIRNV